MSAAIQSATVQIEVWHLIGFFIGQLVLFVGAMWALGKVVIHQFEQRLAERFAAQDAARASGQEVWRKTFEAHIEDERREAERLRALERDFQNLRADLPLHYVRREDWVRNQTVIEAKLDGLALKMENMQLKGTQ